MSVPVCTTQYTHMSISTFLLSHPCCNRRSTSLISCNKAIIVANSLSAIRVAIVVTTDTWVETKKRVGESERREANA